MMRKSHLRTFSVIATLVLCAVTVGACSSDDVANPVAIGAGTSYTIPAAGGAVDVTTASGTKLTFTFPASAGGKTITLTPTDSTALGWPAGQFKDVIRMEPDGTTFAEPVVVAPSSKDVILLSFPTRATKSAPEGLPLASNGSGFELRHFSTLVIVPAGVSCDPTNGWTAHPNAPECAQFGSASSFVTFSCQSDPYCLTITASCCADPSRSPLTCDLGDPALKVSYSTSSSPTRPAFCGASTDAGVDATLADATTDGTVESGSQQDAASDGSNDAPAEAGVCGAPSCTLGQTQGTCGCVRTTGSADSTMQCDGQACTCYVNGVASSHFSQTQVAPDPCSSVSQAAYIIDKYCGCTPVDSGAADSGSGDGGSTDAGGGNDASTDAGGGSDAGADAGGGSDGGGGNDASADASGGSEAGTDAGGGSDAGGADGGADASADAGSPPFLTGSQYCNLDADSNYLYIGHCKGLGITRVPLAGGSESALVINGYTLGLTHDATNIYWLDNDGTIRRASLAQVTQIGATLATATTGAYPITDGTNVYWADNNGSEIHKVAVNGTDAGSTLFVSGEVGVDSLAVDAQGGYVYWGATGTGPTFVDAGLRRAPLSTGVAENFEPAGTRAFGLKWDSTFNWLVWKTPVGLSRRAPAGSTLLLVQDPTVTELYPVMDFVWYIGQYGIFRASTAQQAAPVTISNETGGSRMVVANGYVYWIASISEIHRAPQ